MSSFKIKIDEPKLLSEDIAESIKTAIIKGKFKPGEKIPEGELADSMGISRTPLREAFHKLENEGFIQIIPRKGAVVAAIDADEAINIYEIKSTLEGLAARLAARNMKPKDIGKLEKINDELKELIDKNDLESFYKVHTKFHEGFVKMCANKRLIHMISNLNDHFNRFGIISLTLPGQFENAIAQHNEIIEGFKNGDQNLVEERVRTNVMTGGRVLVAHLTRLQGQKEEEEG
ncbi:MAG: GntR family transcriptional regulator [bacterium]|nr:GntR family transcriptional regulator [bacterium]MDT8367384.1 GntR family transcriptional regulator [bacterium]